MATLYQYYIAGDDSRADIYDARWPTQTFTPSTNHIITSVKLLLYRNNNPGTVTVSIRATSGGVPTGADLCSGTTNGNTLETADPYEWREITFSAGALLLADTMYAIVVRATGGDASNSLYWRYDGLNATYPGGQMDFSTDSGVTWPNPTPDGDYMFEDWGDLGGSGEGGAIYPTEAITRVTNLIHRYNRATGVYTLEMALGEVTSDFGLPEWLTRPQPAVPKDVEEQVKEIVKDVLPPEAIPPEIIGPRVPPGAEDIVTPYARRVIREHPEEATILQEIVRLSRLLQQAPGITPYARRVLEDAIKKKQDELETLYRR